jgi:uncharacterized protein YjiK
MVVYRSIGNSIQINWKRMLLIPFLFISFSCSKKNHEAPKTVEIILLATYPLDISDPSGLSFAPIPGHLYTVSDNSGHIYLITKQGQIVESYDINGDDLEGIVYVEKLEALFVVEERLRRVLKTDLDGILLDTFELDNIPVYGLNNGPEGISFNPATDHFYIVNEKEPGRLYVYNMDFQPVADFRLRFATDYSSVFYEPWEDHLWILSDERQTLTRCDLTGQPQISMKTNVPKGEGVVVDRVSKRIYIVCDQTRSLYIYSFE